MQDAAQRTAEKRALARMPHGKGGDDESSEDRRRRWLLLLVCLLI